MKSCTSSDGISSRLITEYSDREDLNDFIKAFLVRVATELNAAAMNKSRTKTSNTIVNAVLLQLFVRILDSEVYLSDELSILKYTAFACCSRKLLCINSLARSQSIVSVNFKSIICRLSSGETLKWTGKSISSITFDLKWISICFCLSSTLARIAAKKEFQIKTNLFMFIWIYGIPVKAWSLICEKWFRSIEIHFFTFIRNAFTPSWPTLFLVNVKLFTSTKQQFSLKISENCTHF